MFVVYLTYYRGGLMPTFYIGYTSESRVNSGYNGTVTSKMYGSTWRQERAEHPELFETEILSHHATDTEALLREEALHRFYDVPNNPAFINMSISRKGFGASGENNPNFGKHLSGEVVDKIRKSLAGKVPSRKAIEAAAQSRMGKPSWNLGKSSWCKGIEWSEEQRKGLRKPKSEEHRRKIGDSNRGLPSQLKGRNQSVITCPHCGKSGGNAMRRWHFDNCKEIHHA